LRTVRNPRTAYAISRMKVLSPAARGAGLAGSAQVLRRHRHQLSRAQDPAARDLLPWHGAHPHA
jgi:hypothetical protein